MTIAPERKSFLISSKPLREVSEMANAGTAGKEVELSLTEGSFLSRISIATLEKMAERNQKLEISVVGDKVRVTLRGRERDRRQAYIFLYKFLQALESGGEGYLLRNISVPAVLLEEMPELGQFIDIIKTGRTDLPEEDISKMTILLSAYWTSLRNKSSLPSPDLVLNSLAY